MNDRMISILDNYDMTVLRTWKGRSAILCETEKGIRILKEYTGPKDKLCVLEAVTEKLRDAGFLTDCLVRNKEGELSVTDRDRTVYILKEYREGRECSVTDIGDCIRAVRGLAGIHRVLQIPQPEEIKPQRLPQATPEAQTEQPAETEQPTDVGQLTDGEQSTETGKLPEPERMGETELQVESEPEERPFEFRMFRPEEEYERYNKELKRIWKHLREKSSKTDFEVFLLRHYAFFMEQAREVLERIKAEKSTAYSMHEAEKGRLCHGDFQHHNILFTGEGMTVINYEKCMQDIQIRDFYLFFRKVMEKNGWNPSVGEQLLSGYTAVRPIEEQELRQFGLRLAYPEKFRKVVSYYYNSGKSWIPGKNREKLERLLAQEEARQSFLKTLIG